MAFSFRAERAKPSKTRKFPYLPRIGVFVDFANHQFQWKQAPVLETIANLMEKSHFDLPSILKISNQQLSEIEFPKEKQPKIINTTAKTVD